MKRLLVLAAIGLFGPIVQGAVSPFVPPDLCPDIGLLLVIALGLTFRNTVAGIGLAAWVGFVCDLLSGALLGQHAIARVFAFSVARLAGFQMNLRGGFTQLTLTAAITVMSALLLSGLTAFFTASTAAPMASAVELARHAAVNALLAPLVVPLVGQLIALTGDDEHRRVLPLEPRSYA